MARKQAPSALARSTREALSLGTADGTALALREGLLEAAGVTPAEQATLTRAAFDKLRDLLSAKRVQRLVVNAGLNTSEVEEFVDEDSAVQARAAAELLDRLGVVVSKSSGNQTNIGALTVIVTKREAPEPRIVDVEVLDSKSA